MENTLNAKYGLKRVINASGRMSILGVSSISDSVVQAMGQGGQQYTEMSDLVHKSGEHIAKLIKAENAVVVNSASSGIALSVAGLMTQGNKRLSERLHQEMIPKNEVIILKGHNVQYGAPVETMVYLGGGKVIEVGYANEGRAEHIIDAINERTVAILYVKSHHAVQKNMISAEDVSKIANEHNIPLIIDAAAEEDLEKYVKLADLSIFSGSKALEGPTTGIVAGKFEYVEWVKVQLHGIGRSMKVGKEAVFGLLQAIDDYMVKEDKSEQEKAALQVLLELNTIKGIRVSIVQDEAGRAIYRARVQVDEKETAVNAVEMVEQLKNGEIAIYTRDYGATQGFFDIDPRPLANDDIDVIKSRIQEIVMGES